MGINKVAVVSLLLVFLAVPSALARGMPPAFPGRELGAQEASDRGFADPSTASYTASGLTLRVLGVVADDYQTVVSYEVTGREADGSTAMSGSVPQLVDASGKTYRMVRGSRDQANRRLGSWVFPSMPSTAGAVSLVIDGFELATPSQGAPLQITKVPGTWRVSLPWDGSKAPSGPTVMLAETPQSFGQGAIVLESIRQFATATVVTGHFTGHSAQAIEAMGCPATFLSKAGGPEVRWISCRLGFGEGNRSFEVNYPPVAGPVTLRFQLLFPSPPGAPPVPSELRIGEGATVAVDVQLPPRP